MLSVNRGVRGSGIQSWHANAGPTRVSSSRLVATRVSSLRARGRRPARQALERLGRRAEALALAWYKKRFVLFKKGCAAAYETVSQYLYRAYGF